MSNFGVRFEKSESEVVDSSSYHQGEIVSGCRVDVIQSVEADIRSVFEETKPSRSIEYRMTELDVGCIVDIDYRKSSHSVNTPYRVADIYIGDKEFNETFENDERNFQILFEPIIQNASLVLLDGTERITDDGSHILNVKSVYHKRKWNTSELNKIPVDGSMKYESEFIDIGFKPKERRINNISIVFDEVISQCVGIENELVPIII